MTRPAGVVFDLDGTLVLTEGRNAVVWRSFFEGNGIGYDDELAHHVMGRRAQDSLVELMHLFPDRPTDELIREVTDIDLAVPLSDARPVAGAVHLVRRLADALASPYRPGSPNRISFRHARCSVSRSARADTSTRSTSSVQRGVPADFRVPRREPNLLRVRRDQHLVRAVCRVWSPDTRVCQLTA
jgi:beta-phosphoglucomutase-like phosphatase (HAD superfamily)